MEDGGNGIILTMHTNRQHWNATWKRGLGETNAFAKRAAKELEPQAHVLDLGCGTGKDALFFAAQGHVVTAMDFAESALAALRTMAERRDLAVTTVCGDIGAKLPFKDGTFDAVYAHLSLHYFDNAHTARVFREVHRVLKKGGLFFVKCKSVDDPLYGKGERVGEDMYVYEHLRHFFRKEFMEQMLAPFMILRLKRSSSAYRGKRSAFIEAWAKK